MNLLQTPDRASSVTSLCVQTILSTCILCSSVANTEAADIDPADRSRIEALAQQLFVRTLSTEQLQPLLNRLVDSDSRAAASLEIMRLGRGCQAEIAEFANAAPDIEVGEACADMVSQLDDGWRDTPDGRSFCELCRTHAEALFPAAWERFCTDGTDQAACAMILSADPTDVWKWISQMDEVRKLSSKKQSSVQFNGSRENPLDTERSRYVLLRIRELSPDTFAAHRIPEIPNLYAGSLTVFQASSGSRCYRTVGHVQLKRINTAMDTIVVSGGFQHRHLVYFYPRHYQLFQSMSQAGSSQIRHKQSISFDKTTYGPYRRDERLNLLPLSDAELQTTMYATSEGFERGNQDSFAPNERRSASEISLPQLHLSVEHRDIKSLPAELAPWWWRPYVSNANASRMKFTDRKPESFAPAEITDTAVVGIGPTGNLGAAPTVAPDAASFVILPPRLLGPSGPHLAAADLTCDRLAEELEAQSVHIVDRKHLQKILDERELTNASAEPLTGFDAFVRLQVANDRLNPEATLSVVKLSTGSAVAEEVFEWPIPESEIPRIRTLLKTALNKMQQGDERRIKVRLLGTQLPDEIRMRPFAARLSRLVEQSLHQNKQLLIVDHFEAASASEESLLLLMGLSRIPGGREFGPAADVTVGLKLAERNAVGQSFENTPLEVQIVVRSSNQREQIETVNGTVSDFESHIVPALCEKLNARLTEPGSSDAAGMAEDFAVRQSQAKQELAAIKAIDVSLSPVDQALVRRQHAQTALKLDPTALAAVFEVVRAHQAYIQADSNAVDRQSIALEGLELVANRLEDFTEQPDAMQEMLGASNTFAFALGIFRLRHQSQFSGRDAEQNRQVVNAAARVAEASVKGSPYSVSPVTGNLLQSGFLGLKASGKTSEVLSTRLNAIIDNLERLRDEYSESTIQRPDTESFEDRMYTRRVASDLRHARRNALTVCCTLGLVEQFDRLLPIIQHDIEDESSGKFDIDSLRGDVKTLGDPRRMADFETWARHQSNLPVVSIIETEWPRVDVFSTLAIETANVDSHPIDLSPDDLVSPLVKTSDRLYFATGKAPFIGWNTMVGSAMTRKANHKLGYLPLDSSGRPSGSVEFIELPPAVGNLTISSCVANDDSLVLGTTGVTLDEDAGLYVLDVAENTWKHVGVGSGLPASSVSSMHLLSDDRALCTGMARHGEYACFTFNLQTHAIQHFAVGTTPQQHYIPRSIRGVYEREGVVCGFSEHGWWRDLLSEAPVMIQPQPASGPIADKYHFTGIRDACVLRDRIFFNNDVGLHETNPAGEVLTSWGSSSAFRTSFENEIDLRFIAPPKSPMPSSSILVPCGDLLLMFQQDGNQVVGFDPTSETWFGPISIPRTVRAVTDGQFVWLGGSAMHRLDASEIVSAAKRCGRAMTMGEFHAKQRSIVAQMSGLQRAKTEFATGHFDESQRHLEPLLVANPKDAEARYISGLLFDTWGLNRPETAEKAYQRAAELEESASLSFTADLRRALMLKRIGRDADAQAVAEQILIDYPRMESSGLKDRVKRLAEP